MPGDSKKAPLLLVARPTLPPKGDGDRESSVSSDVSSPVGDAVGEEEAVVGVTHTHVLQSTPMGNHAPETPSRYSPMVRTVPRLVPRKNFGAQKKNRHIFVIKKRTHGRPF